ncbi:hypothetical protein HPC49_03685 [Pyxidicoccus fallax]|uniref:Lipoprotein n=1 Tax=Pyxidicoccus fallax TaxID=394095 RepID=A0A848LQY7_9BACT|nr:hypothetical protein [Pyxidicoccus fallax]NMO20089.1 hypothetical protein [Pyxidicoccus fallax]NPC77357.1 hypothetical protein [Pyxidicoccus fallax]
MKKNVLFSVGAILLSTACGSAGSHEAEEPGLAQERAALYGDITRVTGDVPCPSGYVMASPEDAQAYQGAACGNLASWDIARLSGSGAMRGPGYGCNISSFEANPLGHTLCKDPSTMTFLRATGDSPCGPGKTLLTAQEASARRSEVCAKLASWDIARLEDGGTMKGPGYGCTISTWDTQGVGHALCKSLN